MMSDAVQIEIIRTVPLILGTIGAFAAALFSYRAATHSKEAIDVAKKTEKNTNGMSERLNAVTRTAAFAEGVLQERTRVAAEEEAGHWHRNPEAHPPAHLFDPGPPPIPETTPPMSNPKKPWWKRI
jgi:hypothetical protein